MPIDDELIRVAAEGSPTMKTFRSHPMVNENDDMVRITIDMPLHEGRKFFRQLCTNYMNPKEKS